MIIITDWDWLGNTGWGRLADIYSDIKGLKYVSVTPGLGLWTNYYHHRTEDREAED